MDKESIYTRTEMVLGKEGVDRLRASRVIIFGVGGVGGFALEAMARSGVGSFTLVDSDTVNVTNLNRQIIATTDTIGEKKVDAAKARILSINPEAVVDTRPVFFSEENRDSFDLSEYDYVIDAIDSVRSKIALICLAKEYGVKIISSMGAGNKLDPTRFRITDIYKTSVDPLAKAIRSELKKRGVKELKVVFSDEPPVSVEGRAVGSLAFIPSVAGLIIGGEVIKELSGI